MNKSPQPAWRRTGYSLGVVAAAIAVLASGCAQVPGFASTPSAVGGGSRASQSASPTLPTVSPTPLPTIAPSTTTPPPPPDPFKGLSAKQKKAFKACLPKAVGPGSAGTCAKLVIKNLKAAKLYPWATTSRITAVGVNAILNYQRSRGLKANGVVTKKTWLAMAAKTPVVPVELPKKCLGKGVVLCVSQAHRKLFYVKNGKVLKTVKVRLGGYTTHPKTGKWRNFPTADGTWKVYNKNVDPYSENYGYGAMPYSVIFYPDMYVHYSPGFDSSGYRSSSHGCVNIGSRKTAIWIYKNTPIGAKVHIYSQKAA